MNGYEKISSRSIRNHGFFQRRVIYVRGTGIHHTNPIIFQYLAYSQCQTERIILLFAPLKHGSRLCPAVSGVYDHTFLLFHKQLLLHTSFPYTICKNETDVSLAPADKRPGYRLYLICVIHIHTSWPKMSRKCNLGTGLSKLLKLSDKAVQFHRTLNGCLLPRPPTKALWLR